MGEGCKRLPCRPNKIYKDHQTLVQDTENKFLIKDPNANTIKGFFGNMKNNSRKMTAKFAQFAWIVVAILCCPALTISTKTASKVGSKRQANVPTAETAPASMM